MSNTKLALTIEPHYLSKKHPIEEQAETKSAVLGLSGKPNISSSLEKDGRVDAEESQIAIMD